MSCAACGAFGNNVDLSCAFCEAKEEQTIREQHREELREVTARAVAVAYRRFQLNFAGVAGWVDVYGDPKTKGMLAAAENSIATLDDLGCFR